MINPIAYNTSYNNYYPSFCLNPNSPKLRFRQSDFFVKIRGYGKSHEWATEIIKTADLASKLFRANTSAENILKLVTIGVRNANKITLDLDKRQLTGILRSPREDWLSSENNNILTAYESGRYSVYKDRLDNVEKSPLKTSIKGVGLSRPTPYQDILHGPAHCVNSSLDYVFKLCKKLFPKFIKQDATDKDLPEINDDIAEIRWVLAHSTPWRRGSDAISNVFMRAIYKAMGIKTYPLKKNVSLDLEAYCTELEDYKKNFPNYFEKEPTLIE